MRAVVTDAHERSAVAFIRGLRRAGVEVDALGPTRGAAGRWSRGLAGRATGPDAGEDPAGYAAAVARLARAHGPLVVYPGREESIDALLDRAGDLPPEALLPYPPAAVLRRVRDKRVLPELAAKASLRTPRTLHQGPAGSLRGAAMDEPCVLKPLDKGKVLDRAHVVRSARELEAALEGVPDDEEVSLQAIVEGGLSALCLVVSREGATAARVQQETRLTWPAEAGPSRVAVTVAPDEELTARATAMLAAAGFWGLAQVQFLQGRAGACIIDVNPRPYGSLPLALAAGVNLPAVWHAVATGRPAPDPAPYRVGVTYRWLEADLIAALRGEPRRLFGRAPRPRAGAMWAGDDPVASALLAGQATRDWLGRQSRRLKRVSGIP